MQVNRQDFLQALQSVSAGLSQKEVEEQSSCFAFKDGYVMTYNGELACWAKLDVGFTGAVPSEPFIAILDKLPDDIIDITAVDGAIKLRCKNKRSTIRMEAEVLLPIDTVEQAKGWQPLAADFCEAVSLVVNCASTDDESGFAITCVNVTPEHVEACDNWQLCRYPVETPIDRATLVRREAIKHIVGLDMTKVALSKNWIHFKNPAGLVLSCRRYKDEYPDLTPLIGFKGDALTLPGGLSEAVERAEVFSSDNAERNQVEIALATDLMKVKGSGSFGMFEEKKRTSYEGRAVVFMIDVKILLEITKRNTDCQITKDKLKVATSKFTYVSVLSVAGKQTEEEPAEADEE